MSPARHAAEPFLAEPLDRWRAQALLQRDAASTLEEAVARDIAVQKAVETCRFIAVDLALYTFEIENVLVPLLSARCKTADDVGSIVEELLAELDAVRGLALQALRVLITRVGRSQGPTIASGRSKILHDLATRLRKLSALEIGIVLPLAQARLNSEDLTELVEQLGNREDLAAGRTA